MDNLLTSAAQYLYAIPIVGGVGVVLCLLAFLALKNMEPEVSTKDRKTGLTIIGGLSVVVLLFGLYALPTAKAECERLYQQGPLAIEFMNKHCDVIVDCEVGFSGQRECD